MMEDLFTRIKDEYNIEIRDSNDMTSAWKLVEALKEREWVIYIITSKGRNQVDAWHQDFGSLFAQFGKNLQFRSVLEGICNMALLVKGIEVSKNVSEDK